MMTPQEFLAAYREAFGEKPELPLVFGYTNEPKNPVAKTEGCFFKALRDARKGTVVSLNASNIGCGGGKLYTGFSPMPEYVPQFVSLKERYKQTPELVVEGVEALDIRTPQKAWLEFTRLDLAETFDGAEGIVFFASPDVLSGLVSWATFDFGAGEAVAAPWGSGCSSVVTQTVQENRNGGKRCFLGLFDPSVRPWVDASSLSFTIPMSRFDAMCATMHETCLFNGHAWPKLKERINS